MEQIGKRNHALDLLRVLACYMVIQVHAGEYYYIGADGAVINGSAAYWVDIYNSLFRSAVPLFVMLSGFFLLPVKESLGIFFKKRFTRVVIPFVVWCVLYAFYHMVMGQVTLSGALMNILKIPVNFGVDVGHLWYVYMLIGLYLVAPVISPWLNSVSRRNLEFYLCLWAFTLFLPYIHRIFPAVLGECFWNPTPLLYYFSGLLGYMVLAFYIKRYWMEKKAWNLPVALLLIIVGYAATAGGFAYRLGFAPFVWDLELTWGYGTINVAMMSLGLFLIVKNIRFKNLQSPFLRLITSMSELSYGIYLLHIMILNLFFAAFDPWIETPAIKIPLISILTFIVSYLVIKLLSYLPKSKYIVG
ncbi:MAG: acyltransferase family protein [Bacteroidales bacterium]|nr:acyltransferase family protein [Bacteroidales bacterium]